MDRSVNPLPVVRAANLEAPVDTPRWLIETLWTAAAVGVVGGNPKSMKTWTGLEMAVSVATGTPCLDHFEVHDPGPALLYLAEDRPPAIRERLEALCSHRGLRLDSLDVHVITAPTLRLDVSIDVQRLDATVDRLAPKLLLLDPFVRLHRGDENSSQDVAAILADLREIQRRHQVAIAIVHHTRKNNRAAQQGQTLRGSGDLHAWIDSGLYLSHENDALRLTIEHRSAPTPKPRHLRLTGDPPHLMLVAVDDEEQPATLEDRVLETLRRSPTPMRRNTLRSLLAVNNARLGEALATLDKLGRIHRTDCGWTC